MFAKTISSFLSDLYHPKMSQEQLLAAIISALIASCLILIADLLTGEAEYRCGAKARINLRKEIFEKMLQLDVGKIERIGASNTISSVGDGVELMQVYYTKYLPSLLYCFFAPVYLFFQLKDTSLLVATIPVSYTHLIRILRQKYLDFFRRWQILIMQSMLMMIMLGN